MGLHIWGPWWAWVIIILVSDLLAQATWSGIKAFASGAFGRLEVILRVNEEDYRHGRS